MFHELVIGYLLFVNGLRASGARYGLSAAQFSTVRTICCD
jgi:hypothetical protein